MVKSSRRASAHEPGKWFAPPSGGYSGRFKGGAPTAADRRPPKIPATPEGVLAMQERQQQQGGKGQ